MTNDDKGHLEPIAEARDQPAVSTWQIVKEWLKDIWRARRPPRIKIVGIEVVQAVQRFSLTAPALNNSVPLVARKRTMVRVYLDSPAFLWWSSVTGTLKLSSVGSGPGGMISGVSGPGGHEAWSPLVVAPINQNGSVRAEPLEWIGPANLDSTLNFAPPVDVLSGPVRLQVDAHGKGIFGLLARGRASTVVEFHERRLPERLVYILIDHPSAPAPATSAYYYRCLDHVIAMYPAPDADFLPLYHLPGEETIEIHSDLRTDAGWKDMMNQVQQIAERLPPGFVLTALLPVTLGNPWAVGSGFFSPDRLFHEGEAANGGKFAVFLDGNSFGHELGHHYGLNHAGQGNPNERDEDPRIPSDTTDEWGLDMSKRLLMPRGSWEMMFYQNYGQWLGTGTWQALFERFAP